MQPMRASLTVRSLGFAIALAALGFVLVAPETNAQSAAKARSEFEVYEGNFTYAGPKGRFEGTGTVRFENLDDDFPGTSDGNYSFFLMVLRLKTEDRDPWICRISVDQPIIRISDVTPFDKNELNIRSSFQRQNEEGLDFATNYVPFEKGTLKGGIRVELNKQGKNLELLILEPSRKDGKSQPTIKVLFRGKAS